MNPSRFAGCFDAHTLAVDRQQRLAGRAGRGGRGAELSSSPPFFDQGFHAGIGGSQGELACQASLNSVRQVQPVLRWRRLQTSEGAEDALSRTLGSVDRFDQEIVVVAFALVSLGGLADVHRTLYIVHRPYITSIISTTIRHYLLLFVTILRLSTTRVEDKELLSRNPRKSAKHRGSSRSEEHTSELQSRPHL